MPLGGTKVHLTLKNTEAHLTLDGTEACLISSIAEVYLTPYRPNVCPRQDLRHPYYSKPSKEPLLPRVEPRCQVRLSELHHDGHHMMPKMESKA